MEECSEHKYFSLSKSESSIDPNQKHLGHEITVARFVLMRFV